MNNNKKVILDEIFKSININSDEGTRYIMFKFNDIDIALQSYESDFVDDKVILKDVLELRRDISIIYYTLITDCIREFSESEYAKSLDFVLTNYSQENIVLKLERFLNSKGFPQQFKCDVFEYVKVLADRLNKRFSFDEISLINLIEASKGSNIILEEGSLLDDYDKNLVYSNGKYDLKSSKNKSIYTSGGKIPDSNDGETKEDSEIRISDFPMGNNFTIENANDALNKVMRILFENLNLCIETYRTIYTSENNVVENNGVLADGSTIKLFLDINDKNIPHLLGIPTGASLSQKAIDFLNIICNSSLSHNSSALDVLLTIYNNQDAIISANGLYEDNGKKYEIINWEKVVLKTSSFMRGDFFKTCFCLAQINPNKYLVSSKRKGGYVSISSTEYNRGLNTTKTSREILNDLLNARRQKRDFIFKGIYPDSERPDKLFIYSIMTGKSENIHVGKRNELLYSLQRYRDLFSSGDSAINMEQGNITHVGKKTSFNDVKNEALFASIVEEIENEKFIKRFTPEEQADLGLSISRNLSVVPQLSPEALNVLQNVHMQSGAVTESELNEFDHTIDRGHNKR